MKKFFYENGMSVVKLYINQIAMSVFALMVVVGFAGGNGNSALIFFASLITVGLYLFIIYSMMWDEGARAAAVTLRAEDAGVQKIKTPLLIVFFGSLLNILGYIVYTILQIVVVLNHLTEGTAYDYGYMTEVILKITNAIYMGFEALLFTGNTVMRTPAYYFFLTLIPLFAVGIIAYYLGASEISIMRKLGFKTKHKSTTRINYDKNKK